MLILPDLCILKWTPRQLNLSIKYTLKTPHVFQPKIVIPVSATRTQSGQDMELLPPTSTITTTSIYNLATRLPLSSPLHLRLFSSLPYSPMSLTLFLSLFITLCIFTFLLLSPLEFIIISFYVTSLLPPP